MKKSKMKSEIAPTLLRSYSATAKPMHPLIKDLRAFYADQIKRGHSEREAWRAVCMGLPVCITTCHLARLITQPLSHNSVREAQTTNSEKSEKEIK